MHSQIDFYSEVKQPLQVIIRFYSFVRHGLECDTCLTSEIEMAFQSAQVQIVCTHTHGLGTC